MGKVSCYSFRTTRLKLIVLEKPPFKSFFTKLNCRKRKWILNISADLAILKQSLEKHSISHDDLTIFGDFNGRTGNKAIEDLYDQHN